MNWIPDNSGGLSMRRRGVLTAGVLTAFGVGIGARSTLRAGLADGVSRTGKARNCILIWLDGGPSHLETWDLKPEAPKEVRGPLSPIKTSVPGIDISECLPLTAQQMQHFAIIRSMTSPLGEHNLGAHYVLTGYQPSPVLEYPSFSSVACSVRASVAANQAVSSTSVALPSHIAVPDYRIGGANFSGAGFLPSQFRPFSVGSDPAAESFRVRDLESNFGLTIDRLARRQQYASQLDELRRHTDADRESASDSPRRTHEFDQAFEMLTSRDARGAFDLKLESSETRQRYGMKTIGQACLLARRLVERGVPFVTVNQRGWDTHANLYTQLKEGYTGARVPVGLIPSLDLALSALIDDLLERGLLDSTLIAVMGEFGRTPKLNAAAGRDHWPRCFSVALAGGGIRGGQVIGASDRTAESPADLPVTPSDLIATVYSLLGLDPQTEIHTADGRPIRLVPNDARGLSELLA